MKTTKEKIEKTYTIIFQDADYKRHADVVFINGVFSECIFATEKERYNSLDWKWLNELSSEVLKLIQKEEKENLKK